MIVLKARSVRTDSLCNTSGWRRPFCVVAAILLAGVQGCMSLQGQHGAEPVIAPTIGAAQSFMLKGRLSVRVGQRLETGQITWARASHEEKLEIFTPFGSQVAEIVKTGSRVIMRKGEEIVGADSIAALTAELLGVPLDLDVIAAWTQGAGLVDGEMREVALANGDVWQVTAERFQIRSPYRFASRLSAVRGDIVVRLVIDQWQAS
jgi:outer membrane biogenesis lipoprotein LolB